MAQAVPRKERVKDKHNVCIQPFLKKRKRTLWWLCTEPTNYVVTNIHSHSNETS